MWRSASRWREVARGLGGARAVAGRCVWRRAGEITILDDTYNASPVSIRAALETVGAHRRGRRVVVVLGDMLELGNISDEAHREVGRMVAALPADELHRPGSRDAGGGRGGRARPG